MTGHGARHQRGRPQAGHRRVGLLVALAAALTLGAVATSAQAASGLQVVSISNTPSTVDTTYETSSDSENISVHIVDPGATAGTIGGLRLYTTTTPASPASGYVGTGFINTLSSGTDADGVWTGGLGFLPASAGTEVPYELVVYSGTSSATLLDVSGISALAALGATPVTATVSAPPSQPTVTSQVEVITFEGIPEGLEAQFTLQEAGALGNYVIDSLKGGGCPTGLTGAQTSLRPGAYGYVDLLSFGFGFCTIKLHATNPDGSSAETTAVALF